MIMLWGRSQALKSIECDVSKGTGQFAIGIYRQGATLLKPSKWLLKILVSVTFVRLSKIHREMKAEDSAGVALPRYI